ncbi:sulfatase [Reichenbachiella ulvae]|uniref:Sulfatase n=1 Tax=Reichenbachiella ulvae TaxID=2980104 RepID=A0ABT3CZY6_9BACT|nr:sulfatase [Reichenbachiella ulvae]MCV9389256.1 sulfatase [Reichenbachiella ulvae]
MRRWILLLGIVLSSFSGFSQEKEKPPNFLFIAVDDLNIYNSPMGNYPGNFLEKIYPSKMKRSEVIQRLTPNLDRLGQQSMIFNRAFSAAPLCGPSRTALLTGTPPHVSGYYQHDQHFRGYSSLTNVVTLPQHLKNNGYYTVGIGKVFHKGRSYLDRGVFSDWPDQLYSWSEWVEVHSGTAAGPDYEFDKSETPSRYWESDGKRSHNYTRFGSTSVPREKANDYLNAQFIADLIVKGEAIRQDLHGKERNLTLPQDKPFFLACGLFAPHLPWVVPQEYLDMFPIDEMAIDQDLLDWIESDLKDLSAYGQNKTRNTHMDELRRFGIELDGKGGDMNAWKAYLQAYLATIAYSDRNIGVLVDAIEQNPQKDNTVVMLWSDHGYHVGDKNRSGKVTLWEAANHCNLIIRDPRIKESTEGKRAETPVSLQDLYPTVVSLADLDKPEHVHGVDLSLILKNSKEERGQPVLNTNGKDNHALRTDGFRYIRFRNGDQELYDLEKDPFEEINLAKSEKHQELLNSLYQQLNEMLKTRP